MPDDFSHRKTWMDIAGAVREAVDRIDKMEAFRSEVKKAGTDWLKRCKKNETRQRKRRDHLKKSGIWMALPEDQANPHTEYNHTEAFVTKFPTPPDIREDMLSRAKESGEADVSFFAPLFEYAKSQGFPQTAEGREWSFELCGLIPPELLPDKDENESLLLPLLGGKVLSNSEKLAVLAAIHDAHWLASKQIAPWTADDERLFGWYGDLVAAAGKMLPECISIVRSWLPQLAKLSRKKKARKKRSDSNKDKQIFDAWKTGRYNRYAELAREMEIDEEEVKYALDRHRHRYSQNDSQ